MNKIYSLLENKLGIPNISDYFKENEVLTTDFDIDIDNDSD